MRIARSLDLKNINREIKRKEAKCHPIKCALREKELERSGNQEEVAIVQRVNNYRPLLKIRISECCYVASDRTIDDKFVVL